MDVQIPSLPDVDAADLDPDQAPRVKSSRRYKRALTSSGAGALAQIVQLATALITVPLTLHYLGGERYGLWMTLTSLAIVLVFADLGVGIGLQNELAKCHGLGNKDQARAVVSVGTAFYASIFLLIVIVCIPITAQLPLSRWMGVQSASAQSDLVPAFRIVILGLAIGMFAGLAQRLLDAHQRGYEVQLALTVGRVVSVFAIWLIVRLNGGMSLLVAAVAVLPHFFVIAMGTRFLFRNPSLSPRFSATQLSILAKLLRTGGAGLLAVIAYALVSNTGILIIAGRWGAAQVTAYAVTMRIVMLATGLLFTLVSPLWPAYGEAFASGDREWVRTAFRRSAIAAAPPFAAGFVALAILGRPLIHLWTGSAEAVPSVSLLLGCVTFGLLSICNVLASTLLNGMSHFIGQGTYGLALAAMSLWLAGRTPASWGVEAVVWVIDAGFLLRCACMVVEVNSILNGQSET